MYRHIMTVKQMGTKQKKNLKKQHCQCWSPDTEYLYYPLDVEGVTLEDSLLPANTR